MEHRRQLGRGQAGQRRPKVDRLYNAGPARAGQGLGVGTAVKVDAFGLEPVAGVAIGIGGRRQLPCIARCVFVANDHLLVVGRNPVERRQTVAAFRIGTKVRIGKPEVALVGTLPGQLDLEFRSMGRLWRRVGELDGVVANIESGVRIAAINDLVAVREPLMGFQEIAKALTTRATVGSVDAVGAVLTGLDKQRAAGFGRNRGRNHVKRAADGVGALADCSRPFEDFEGRHAAGGREIVGGGCGVRRGRYQHAVLEQGDATAAFGGNAPDAQVGTQAEAVLHLDGDPRDLAGDALDVGVREACQRLGVQNVRRAGRPFDLLPRANDGDFLEIRRFVSVLVGNGQACSQCRQRQCSVHPLPQLHGRVTVLQMRMINNSELNNGWVGVSRVDRV